MEMRAPPPGSQLQGGQTQAAVGPGPAEALLPVGLIGEGALINYAAALFGLAEPFTVVTQEPTSMLWISVDDRPVNSWPRDVVQALHRLLKAKTEWHRGRVQQFQVNAVGEKAKHIPSKGEVGVASPAAALAITDSPFLRHKELQSTQTQGLRDRLDAENGWMLADGERAPALSLRCAQRGLVSEAEPFGISRSSLASRGAMAAHGTPLLAPSTSDHQAVPGGAPTVLAAAVGTSRTGMAGVKTPR